MDIPCPKETIPRQSQSHYPYVFSALMLEDYALTV